MRLSKPREVVDDFASIIKSHGGRSCTGDGHYRESAREHLEPHHVEHVDAPGRRDGKSEMHLHARKMIHEGRVRLPDHPRLLTQLRQIVSKPAPGGGLIISSPRRRGGGGHGDLASALVCALWAARDAEPGWARAAEEYMRRRGRDDSGAPRAIEIADVELTQDDYGSIYMSIEGVDGNATAKWGDSARDVRFSPHLFTNEAFKRRILQWWNVRFGRSGGIARQG